MVSIFVFESICIIHFIHIVILQHLNISNLARFIFETLLTNFILKFKTFKFSLLKTKQIDLISNIEIIILNLNYFAWGGK